MRVALIGSGKWGANLLRELVDLGTQVVVVDCCARARQFALQVGAAEALESLDECDGGSLLGFFVATPASTHADVALQLRRFNKPVFMEKPLALSEADARRVVDAIDVYELHTWRYHPVVLEMKRLIAEGEIGEVLHIGSVRSNWTSPRVDCSALWTLMPHDISIFLDLLGGVPKLVNVVPEVVNQKMVGAVATFCYERVNCVAEVSTRSVQKRRELHVRGSTGVLSMHQDDGCIVLAKGDETSRIPQVKEYQVEGDSALRAEMKACLGYLSGGAKPVTTAEEALQINAVMVEIEKRARV